MGCLGARSETRVEFLLEEMRNGGDEPLVGLLLLDGRVHHRRDLALLRCQRRVRILSRRVRRLGVVIFCQEANLLRDVVDRQVAVVLIGVAPLKPPLDLRSLLLRERREIQLLTLMDDALTRERLLASEELARVGADGLGRPERAELFPLRDAVLQLLECVLLDLAILRIELQHRRAEFVPRRVVGELVELHPLIARVAIAVIDDLLLPLPLRDASEARAAFERIEERADFVFVAVEPRSVLLIGVW